MQYCFVSLCLSEFLHRMNEKKSIALVIIHFCINWNFMMKLGFKTLNMDVINIDIRRKMKDFWRYDGGVFRSCIVIGVLSRWHHDAVKWQRSSTYLHQDWKRKKNNCDEDRAFYQWCLKHLLNVCLRIHNFYLMVLSRVE